MAPRSNVQYCCLYDSIPLTACRETKWLREGSQAHEALRQVVLDKSQVYSNRGPCSLLITIQQLAAEEAAF